MKLSKRICALSIAGIMIFSMGAYAGSNTEKITAYLNKGLTLKVDGEVLKPTEDDGSRLYPIVYNGRTYVPAKVVAEKLGASVDYNSAGNGTVIITSGANRDFDDQEGRPVKDAEPSSNDKTSSENVSTSDNGSGTLSSPIAMNQKYTWTATENYIGDDMTGTYSYTVKGVKKISLDDVEDLGFRRPEAKDNVEYALVDIAVEVKNAELKERSGQGYAYLSAWARDIWGVKTPTGESIIGATDYGFDGSLDSAVRDACNFKKVTPGMKESFKAQGKVLMTLYKNKTNYMVIRNHAIEDYDSSFIYFKLK
jgi:hypothetical protein